MINMEKNSAKYSQSINFSQLTLDEKTKIKNLVRARPDLAVSQSSASRIQTNMRKFNPTLHAKRKYMRSCFEIDALLSFLVTNIIISYPALQQEGPTSRLR
jgi:hypothetical protein